MFRRISAFVFAGCMLMNMCGCFAIVAGTAGGAGTAIWLSGKLSQELHSPYEPTIKAAKKALSSLRLKITKETKEEQITQLKSKYTDNKEIWIDIRKITDSSTKVEVRVGAVNPDKEAANKILRRIEMYL